MQNGLEAGPIVGIVIGSVAFVAIVIIVAVCCIKKGKSRKVRTLHHLNQTTTYTETVH